MFVAKMSLADELLADLEDDGEQHLDPIEEQPEVQNDEIMPLEEGKWL